MCFSEDLTYFFVAEWRAEDVDTDLRGDRAQLVHVSGEKTPPLDIVQNRW
jgi:hypothetical protein